MDERKETLSFFIYMWNKFSLNEAIHIYGENLGNHIWDKFVRTKSNRGIDGAIGYLVAELDTDNLDILVNRACELYVGRKNE